MSKPNLNLRSLLPKQKQSSPLEICNDIPRFYKEVCGLKIDGDPAATTPDKEPQAWMQQDPNSMSQHAARFFRKPHPPGKWGRLLLMPRGSGKSGIFRAECLREIITNRDITICYTSQNISMAKRRVVWVKGRLRRNEGRFGAFQGDSDWSDEQFTVVRPSGFGEDPTMFASAPGKDVTGGHPRRFKLDDLVAKDTNKTARARRNVIEWFEVVEDERTQGARMDAIGTMWSNYNLYCELIDKYADYWEIVIMGPYGPARDPNGNIVWDAPTDQLNFPWLTEKYLEFKRKKSMVKYRAQQLQERTTTEDAPYEPDFLREGAPPMDDKGNFDSNLTWYMVADTAQSERSDAAKTALAVVAKGFEERTIDDPKKPGTPKIVYEPRLWIADAELRRFNPADVQDAFLKMYYKWSEKVDLLYATLEDRGGSRGHIYTIPQLAEARGTPRPNIVSVPRASEEAKIARIQLTYRPFKAGEIFFHTAALGGEVPPGMFRIEKGHPRGEIANEILNYAPYGDCGNDFLDALSDAFLFVKEGAMCPAGPHKKKSKKKLSGYDLAFARAAGKLRKVRII